MVRRLVLGAIAGAAGTTALNAVTYADMAWRGRPASRLPEAMVEQSANSLGVTIPGKGEIRDHRVEGLAALSGLATGVAFGTAYGVLDAVGLRPAGWRGALLVAAGAMAGTNVPMAIRGVSDPREWSAADWWSDIVPHLAYGVVVECSWSVLERWPKSRR